MVDPNTGPHPSKKYWTTNLDLTVTIRYREPKATRYFSKFDKHSVEVLRKDLLALKIPHPKADKICLASHGVVEFSWSDIEPYKVLHNNLIQKLRPHDPHYREIFRQVMEESQIARASFWESPAGQGSRGAPSKKRPYADSMEESELLPPSKKFAPALNPHRSGNLSAEQFLNDTLKTLAVKSEPIDAPLPLAQAPDDSDTALRSRVPLIGSSESIPNVSPRGIQLPDPSGSAPLLKDLMHDLWEVRKTISYAREKEETLLEQIQTSHPQFKVPSSDQQDLAALKARLLEAINDAQTQRKLREDLQRSLDEIRQETKEPFVVPSLIDAFLSISKLSAKLV